MLKDMPKWKDQREEQWPGGYNMWRVGSDEYRHNVTVKCNDQLQSYHLLPTNDICNSNPSTNVARPREHDEETVITSNISKNKHTFEENRNSAMNSGKIEIDFENGIADAGATWHFLMPRAPVKNVQPLEITHQDEK